MNKINDFKAGHNYIFTGKSRMFDLHNKIILHRRFLSLTIGTIGYASKDYVLVRNTVHYILLNYAEDK
jgi:hypothetical protein